MDTSQIILSAVIAMVIYIMFLNQCRELDRYGFKVLREGFQSAKRAVEKFINGPSVGYNPSVSVTDNNAAVPFNLKKLG
jgi:hypothetical protein